MDDQQQDEVFMSPRDPASALDETSAAAAAAVWEEATKAIGESPSDADGPAGGGQSGGAGSTDAWEVPSGAGGGGIVAPSALRSGVEFTLADGSEVWAQLTRAELQKLELREKQIVYLRPGETKNFSGDSPSSGDPGASTPQDAEGGGDAEVSAAA